MNNDLISRIALLEEFEWLKMTVGSGSVGSINDAIERVKKAPAVDAEPVRHGRWENAKAAFHKKCSYCKCILHMPRERNFCPECGAKMRGDGDD